MRGATRGGVEDEDAGGPEVTGPEDISRQYTAVMLLEVLTCLARHWCSWRVGQVTVSSQARVVNDETMIYR
jgi:hypothetical protein